MAAYAGIAITPRRFDPSGLARRYAYNYGEAFRRLGLTPLYVDLATADEATLRRLLAPDVKVLFSHGGWIYSNNGLLGAEGREILRQADKPTIILIADPPFYGWLPKEFFTSLPSRAMIFFCDPFFADGISQWIPSGAHAPYLPCRYTIDGFGPTPASRKTLPGLFIGAIKNPGAMYEQMKTLSDFNSLIRPILDAVTDDPFKPLVHAAREAFDRLGVPLDLSRKPVRVRLMMIDQFVRTQRRAQMLKILRHHEVTIVAPGLNGLDKASRARLHPEVDFLGMLRLLGQTKVLYVCPPHFPGALNERIVFAMQAGCLVVATPNARSSQLFEHGRHLLFTAPDQKDLEQRIDQARDDGVAEAIRETASERIQGGYSPEGNLRYMLHRMQDAGLLESALALQDGPELAVPALPGPGMSQSPPMRDA